MEGIGEQDKNYWALLILISSVVTVCGNILVCVAVVKERNLRNITNYFIVSLAVADLLVGLLVMPGAVYVEVNRGAWYLSKELCDVWVACDVMLCTASIFNLCAISLDRLYAVTKPLNYARQRTAPRAFATITTVWVISFAISCPILFGINNVPSRIPDLCILFNGTYMIWSSVFSFIIPAIIMFIVYIMVYIAIRNRVKRIGATENTITIPNITDGHSDPSHTEDRNHDNNIEFDQRIEIAENNDVNTRTNDVSQAGYVDNSTLRPQQSHEISGPPRRSKVAFENTNTSKSQRQTFSMRREKKATKTLAIVLGVFMFCWIPFFSINILFGACPTCSVPGLFIQFALWIGYINSTMNPFIYTAFNLEFRKAFHKILFYEHLTATCCKELQPKVNDDGDEEEFVKDMYGGEDEVDESMIDLRDLYTIMEINGSELKDIRNDFSSSTFFNELKEISSFAEDVNSLSWEMNSVIDKLETDQETLVLFIRIRWLKIYSDTKKNTEISDNLRLKRTDFTKMACNSMDY
ncbi:D(3) dopamine receptor-like [Glandiceps talaboti]